MIIPSSSASSGALASLFDTSVAEERVEVNHRNLIDKILARYSTENAIYRELMQNSDDANSKAVFIKFLTNQNDMCHTIIFENNGIHFREEDWNRLKSIADGNPDEQKIGAFGVGFFSLFSVCENPLVLSGTQCMSIYFKGNHLFVRRTNLLEMDQRELTTFHLEMREPIKRPNFEEFARFLGTSLGFTAKLREITVFHNDKIILELKKEIMKTHLLKIPDNFNISSPKKMFNLKTLEINEVMLYAKENLGKKSTINLRVVIGNLDVNVSEKTENGMERVTKKKCPKKTTFSVIYSNKKEYDTSKEQPIFKDLICYPNQGYIFIGFRTHQTTGCSLHMAARFMPTVERESIDFVDSYISDWNNELLSMGGLLCRIIYDNELQEIGEKFKEKFRNVSPVERMTIFNNKVENPDHEWKSLVDSAIHAVSSFSFKESTPNNKISQHQEACFSKVANTSMLILTSQGVIPLADARALDRNASEFLREIPMIPYEIMNQCEDILIKWNGGNLRKALIEDLQSDLWDRTFTDEETECFLKWFITCSKSKKIEQGVQESIMSMVTIERTSVSLSQIRYWLDPDTIPPELSILKEVLPYDISRSINEEDLSECFKWKKFPLFDWAKIIVTNPDLETNPEFAKKILDIVSKGLLKEKEYHHEIIKLLAAKKCIPTDQGMKLPCQAYESHVKHFDGLPVIDSDLLLIKDSFLLELGVRKIVDPQLVFNRLETDGNWSYIDMINYLTSSEIELDDGYIKIIKEKKMFTKEGNEQNAENSRYKATELYIPDDKLRRLGLPVLDYNKQKFFKDTIEGKFLIDSLGLQTFPPLNTILSLAADSSNPDIQTNAIDFFIDNLGSYKRLGYSSSVDIAFLPCTDSNILVTPSDCFLNEACAILGFNVLHPNYWVHAAAIGVKEHPTVEDILGKFLKDIERYSSDAVKIFEYLALHQGVFTKKNWDIIRNTKFIPIPDKNIINKIDFVNPSECFLKTQNSIPDQRIYMELFPYIDFGSDAANAFLKASGVRTKPSITDLAGVIVTDTDRVYNLCGCDKYLSILREIAEQYDVIRRQDNSLINKMKNSRLLICLKNEGTRSLKASFNERYSLAQSEDIYINDDAIANQTFAPLVAPIEPLLEEFYEKLGSSRLSTQVKVSHQYLGTLNETQKSHEIKQRINERAGIIIHEFMQNNSQQKRKLLHDKAWLEKNLSVMQARNITISRTFNNRIDSKPSTAFVDIGKCTIYISDGILDYYDIATCLCQIFFGRSDRNDSFLMEVYLTASIESLRCKGVPVDRISQLE